MTQKVHRNKKPDENARGRNWAFVLYPDSCGGGWVETGNTDEAGYTLDDLDELLERLEELKIPMVLSPIHDKDLTREGEPEKKHIHGIMTFAGNKSYPQVLEIMEDFGCNKVECVRDIVGAERYLSHLDTKAKRKVQYPIDYVIPLNGYVCKYLAEKREQSEFVQIVDMIEENGIILFADLVYTVSYEHPALIKCISHYQALFNNVCTSRERLVNRELKRNAVKSEKGITPLMSSYKTYRVRFGGVQNA